MSKTEFAKALGCRKATVGKACGVDAGLKLAFNGEPGRLGRIDAAHPMAVAYAKRFAGQPRRSEASQGTGKRGPKTGGKAARDARDWSVERAKLQVEADGAHAFAGLRGDDGVKLDARGKAPADYLEAADVTVVEAMAIATPEHIRAVLDWRVRDVVNRLGNVSAFAEWLKAAQAIARIDETRVKTEQRRGELIKRDLVERHVLGAITDAMGRLVGDTPSALAVRAIELVESGATEAEIAEAFGVMIAQQVSGMKKQARLGLRKTHNAAVAEAALDAA